MTAIGGTALLDARPNSAAPARVLFALLFAMVLADLLYLAGLTMSGGINTPLVNVGFSLLTQWVPVSIFWFVAARTGFRQAPVVLAAAAVSVSAIGDTYYSIAMDAEGYLAFPSPADAGYLLFYPLMVAALVVVVRRQLHGVGRLVLLETAVATVGASAVLAVVLDPVIRSSVSGDSVLENLIAIAYPVFDLLLIAVIVGIVSVPTVRVGRRWWALVVGLAIFVIADVVYALMAAEDTYLAGTPLDATWAVGLAFITWWVAGTVQPGTAKPGVTRRAFPVSLPAVAIVAGLAVLIVGTQVQVSFLAVVLAALTVGLGAVPIIFRQAMLGKLLAAQDEAVRKLTELDQSKTDLLVAVNHEFRTPLTSINGHVELLLDGDAGEIPPAALDMLRTIERNGTRLQALIDETFTASRLEEGPATLTLVPVGVAGILEAAATRLAPFAEAHAAALTVDAVDPALRVDADVAELQHALANLIHNAVKFSGGGGRVVVSADESTASQVVIRVRDQGIGVPAEDIPRLFTRFFRASNVRRSAIPGVGLGLSIAQHIVRAHRGTITAESVEGEGATFTVRLPRSGSVA